MTTQTTIRAIVILIIATLIAIVLLTIFRPGDNTGIVLQIVGIVAPTTAALLALSRSSDNSAQIAVVNDKVDTNTDVTKSTLSASNGHLSAALAEIRNLKDAIAQLTATAAVSANEARHTEANTQQIIGAIQTAVADAAALVPPVELS